jgi:hypothetical protein
MKYSTRELRAIIKFNRKQRVIQKYMKINCYPQTIEHTEQVQTKLTRIALHKILNSVDVKRKSELKYNWEGII